MGATGNITVSSLEGWVFLIKKVNDGADIGCHFRPTAFGAKMHARERERERERERLTTINIANEYNGGLPD